MKIPNLFSYATSELSQDAFLCWLIACSESDDKSLRNLGLDFIAFLYNAGQREKKEIQRNQVAGLVKNEERPYPWTQHCGIDVYFQANINGEVISFIIEDKTGTKMHGDQLKRYADQIENDNIEEKEVRKIYFKTRHVHNREKEKVKEAGYNPINLMNFRGFLSAHSENVVNNIFKDFWEYIENVETKFLSFSSEKFEKWSWEAHQGYYIELEKYFEEIDWEYAANPNGGSLVFYGYPKKSSINKNCNIYLQIDNQKGLFIRVEGVDDSGSSSKVKIEHLWSLLETAKEKATGTNEIQVEKPTRFRTGKTSSFAKIYFDEKTDGGDYYMVKNKDGTIDLKGTVARLKIAEGLVESMLEVE